METRNPRKRQRRCIFCDGSNLTREHVFPNWLRNYIDRKYDRTFHTETTTDPYSGQTETKNGRLNRPGDPLSQRLKVVCAKCNNEWMSAQQTKSKDLLIKLVDNTWETMSPVEAEALSSWITMTTMVLDTAHSIDKVATEQWQRTKFFETKLPPDGWSLFIARRLPENTHMSFNHTGTILKFKGRNNGREFIPTPLKEPLIAKCNLQVTLFYLGSAIFIAVNKNFRWTDIDIGKISEGNAIQVWPLPYTAIQPPPKPIYLTPDLSASKAITAIYFEEFAKNHLVKVS